VGAIPSRHSAELFMCMVEKSPFERASADLIKRYLSNFRQCPSSMSLQEFERFTEPRPLLTVTRPSENMHSGYQPCRSKSCESCMVCRKRKGKEQNLLRTLNLINKCSYKNKDDPRKKMNYNCGLKLTKREFRYPQNQLPRSDRQISASTH
jgi:hypothetical protein